MDTSRLEELGVRPPLPFDEMLRQTVRWMSDGARWNDYYLWLGPDVSRPGEVREFDSFLGAEITPRAAARGENLPPVDSSGYLASRRWTPGWIFAGVDAVFLLAGSLLSPFQSALFVMTPLFLIHLLMTKRRAGEGRGDYALRLGARFLVHMIVALPYAVIGTPAWGDPWTLIAVGTHLFYDGLLMTLDQFRLARRDLTAMGVFAPEEAPAGAAFDFLLPPLERFSVNRPGRP